MAATYGPGLVGSLLIGVSAAKAMALAWDVPFVAVNHLEAHLYAALLEEPELEMPLVVLLVSGGHTLLDPDGRAAAGTGCWARRSTTPRARRSTRSPASSASVIPGGPAIDHLAMSGDPTAIPFPRAMIDDGLRLQLQRA